MAVLIWTQIAKCDFDNLFEISFSLGLDNLDNQTNCACITLYTVKIRKYAIRTRTQSIKSNKGEKTQEKIDLKSKISFTYFGVENFIQT